MRNDNYLPCAAYNGQAAHPTHSDFVAFQDAKTNEYYFAMVDAKGNVLLKSEGYPLEKSRETGLKSVIKNRANEKFFSVKEEEGTYFVSLRAGNYKEIARSCDFKTEKKATAFITSLFEVKAEPKKAKKAAKPAKAKKTTKTAKKPAAAKAKKTVTKVAEVKPVTKKVTGTKVAAAYADINTYMGHATLHDQYGPTGYAKFAADNQHFFVVYNPDQSIYLRSEGFNNEATRDEKFATLQQNIVNPDMYQVRELSDRFAVALVDEQENEIARSAEYTSFTEAFRATPKGRVRNEGVSLY